MSYQVAYRAYLEEVLLAHAELTTGSVNQVFRSPWATACQLEVEFLLEAVYAYAEKDCQKP